MLRLEELRYDDSIAATTVYLYDDDAGELDLVPRDEALVDCAG